MTLHESIEKVLLEAKRPLSFVELADKINEQNLYQKGDLSKVTSNQIAARVKKYKEIFSIDILGVTVHDINLRPFKNLYKAINEIFWRSPQHSSIIPELSALTLLLAYEGVHKPLHIATNTRGHLSFLFDELDYKYFEHLKDFQSLIYKLDTRVAERIAMEIYHLLNAFVLNGFSKPSVEEFSDFYNDVVNEYTANDKFRGGGHSTPKVLSHLIATIYDIPDHVTLFDPFAGTAGLIHNVLKCNRVKIKKVVAGDINETAAYIGTLNILANKYFDFTYQKGDAFEIWREKVNADFFVATPPFNLRSPGSQKEWQFFHSDDFTINSILFALYHTKPDGKIILQVPESILFSNKKDAVIIRQYLLEHDLLQAAILLPKDILRPLSTLSSVLLVIDKSENPAYSGIFVYDASNSSMNTFMDETSRITAAFSERRTIENVAKWVRTTEIDSAFYEINIRQLLIANTFDSEYVQLGDLIETVTTGNYVENNNLNSFEGTPYIQIKDLNDDDGVYTLKRSEIKSFISDLELVNGKHQIISNDAILIARVGTKLKPTFVESSLGCLYSSNIIALKLNGSLSPEYLITQLQSEYVQIQFQAIRRYSGIPTFNLKELKKIKIKLIPLQDQQQYVTTFYSQKIQKVEKDAAKTAEDSLYNIISRIKHEVNQPISSLAIDLKLLMTYLMEKSSSKVSISINDFAVPPLEGQSENDTNLVKIENILNRMNNCIADTQHTLKKAEETLNLSSDSLKFQEFDLKQLLESTIIPLYANANCTFRIKGGSSLIKADSYQLKILFKNLFDNALKHGFGEGGAKSKNIISIQLNKIVAKNMLEITVMNNGNEFQKGFNKHAFETKGDTVSKDNGSGFGGYHIKRIIENHNGEFQITPPDQLLYSEFKVQFKIYLPLIN